MKQDSNSELNEQNAGAENDLSRRDFLRAGCALCAGGLVLLGLGGCNAGGEAGGGAPTASMNGVKSVEAKEGPAGTFTLAGAAKLEKDKALVFQTPAQIPVVVFKNTTGQLQALSAKCTHAGCTVDWKPGDKARFNCPCHHSSFDEAGNVLGGPAKRPLPAYKVQVQGDDAVVVVA